MSYINNYIDASLINNQMHVGFLHCHINRRMHSENEFSECFVGAGRICDQHVDTDWPVKPLTSCVVMTLTYYTNYMSWMNIKHSVFYLIITGIIFLFYSYSCSHKNCHYSFKLSFKKWFRLIVWICAAVFGNISFFWTSSWQSLHRKGSHLSQVEPKHKCFIYILISVFLVSVSPFLVHACEKHFIIIIIITL